MVLCPVQCENHFLEGYMEKTDGNTQLMVPIKLVDRGGLTKYFNEKNLISYNLLDEANI